MMHEINVRDSKITITPDMMHKYYTNLDKNYSFYPNKYKNYSYSYRINEIKVFIIIVVFLPLCIFILANLNYKLQ